MNIDVLDQESGKQKKFNLSFALLDQGLELKNYDDKAGTATVTDNGQERQFDVKGYLGDSGLNVLKRQSAISSGDRLKWGFADDVGKQKILNNSGYSSDQIVRLKGGAYGVKTEGGILPVDPKGFKFGDIAGDIMESAGKAIPTLGSIGGAIGAGGTTFGTGTVAGAAGGAAAGEAGRQAIGEMMGVRQAGIQAGDVGEVLLEGVLGGGAELGAGLVARGASRMIPKGAKGLLPTVNKSGKTIQDLLSSSNPSRALKSASKKQLSELADLGVKDIAQLTGVSDPAILKKAASLADNSGIDQGIWATYLKSVEEGNPIKLSVGLAQEAPDKIAKLSKTFYDDLLKSKKAASAKYGQFVKKVGNVSMDSSPKLASLREGIEEGAESLIKESSDPNALSNFLGRKDVGKALRTFNKSGTLEDLVNLKNAIGGSREVRRARTLIDNPLTQGHLTGVQDDMLDLDSLIREAVNNVDELKQANDFFREHVPALEKAMRIVKAEGTGENTLMSVLKNSDGKVNKILNPLLEGDAAMMKISGAKASPRLGDLMENTVQMKLGTNQGSTTKGTISESILRSTPIVGGLAAILDSPLRVAKRQALGQNLKAAIKSTPQKAIRIVKDLIKKAEQTADPELVKFVSSPEFRTIMAQLGIRADGSLRQSLNDILFGGQQ